MKFTLVGLFCLCLVLNVSTEMIDCTVKGDDGYVYDLSPLGKLQEYYTANDKSENDKYDYHLQVCGDVSKYKSNLVGVSVFQEEKNDKTKKWIAGRYNENTTIGFYDDIIVIKYFNGDYCNRAAEYRSSVISFECADDVGKPVLISEDNCVYVFEWRTTYACKSKTSPGTIFAIVFFTLFFAYFICGFFINMFMNGLSGIQAIPHFGLFSRLFKSVNCCSSNRTIKYKPVTRRDREESKNLVDIEDDDDDLEPDAEEKV